MTFALTYATGTISVANGATSVTGSGVTWTAIREGDSLIDPATGARGIIASIEDTSGALTLLDPWPGTSLTDDAYRIVYDSPARRSGVVVSAAIEQLVAAQTILLARRADYLVQDALLDTPPGSPTAGDVYLVGTSPSGAWSGKAGYLATWTDAAAWAFTAPETGMRVVDLSVDPPAFYFRGASSWAVEAVPDSGVSAGTYGSGTAVAVVTVGADGRITGAEEVAIEVPASGVAADTYGSATEVPVLTIGADGRVTDAEAAPVWRGAYRVLSALTNTPPGSPTIGGVYLVGTSPTGAWSGKAGNLAEWTAASAWAFTAPVAGMQAVDTSATPPQTYVRGSSAWGLDTIGAGGGNSSAVFAPSSGTITTASGDLRISTVGNLVAGELYIAVTDNGTGSGSLNGTMPFAAKASKMMFGINLSTNEALFGLLQVGTTSLIIKKVGSGAYPLASGQSLLMNVGYERDL